MNDFFKGIRPSDVLVTVVIAGLALLVSWENTLGGIGTDEDPLRHAIDVTSWVVYPAAIAMAVPLLWRRVQPLAVVAASVVLMGAHVLALGWSIRCGWALPLSFVLAYGIGRFSSDRGRMTAGFLGVIGVQYLSLVRDSLPGPEILPATVGIAAVACGIGLAVRQQVQKRADRASSAPAGVLV